MDGLALRRLEWDSKFFAFPVFRLDVPRHLAGTVSRERMGEILSRVPGGGVCYVFADESESDDRLGTVLSDCGAVGFGTRVAYCGDVHSASAKTHPQVRQLEPGDMEALDLAVGAGAFSRFSRDPVFAPHYGRLYRRWLENCFAIQNAGRGVVLGFQGDGVCQGMVSASFSGESCKIELMAVDPRFRRQGIGESLMESVRNMAVQRGCSAVTVVTQGENAGACALYRSQGLVATEKASIFHFHR